ncbi:MAG TPA: nucleotidyltransferase domain-containing protein [Bryobacteraceae bacterium]|nr:nucleotidyltransferase domain-containing protein [Bryobacteraceae bacterium]
MSAVPVPRLSPEQDLELERAYAVMDKEEIITRLREHQAELRRGGIERLFLFGSYVRGTAVRDASDVDLIADFDGTKRLTLFDKAGLEVELGELLNSRVDLCDRAMLKEPVRLNAEREGVLVF